MKIELYSDPQCILDFIKKEYGKSYAEMTPWQLSFLSGIIKRRNPQKILEIGVSAGGTTAVILSTLTLLKCRTEMYSVDVSKRYYIDESKNTGFIAEWAEGYLKKKSDDNWTYKLFTGSGVCNYLTDIGKGIDLLILDTMHLCPGELLDFLACLPYLSEDAIVVLHDIAMQYENNKNAFATQLLFDTVVADKMIGIDANDNKHGYPNIGAFQINQLTRSNIYNVFSALNITWKYLPNELDVYRKWLEQYYSKDLMDIFDKAALNNIDSLNKVEEESNEELIRMARLVNRIGGKRVYIYGNGKIGKKLHKVLVGAGIVVMGHVVSSGEEKDNNTTYIDELKITSEDIIVIGVNKKLKQVIESNLRQLGIGTYCSYY